MKREPAGAPGAAPHGVTLFDHATIAAEVAEQRDSIAEVLAKRGLTESAWNESTAYWMQRMLQDTVANQERARAPIVYSQAFSEAQDALAPLKEMSPEGYAELVVELQNAGGARDPLERRQLTSADFQRLVRHFAKRLGGDADEAKRFGDRFAELSSSGGPLRPA